MAIKSEILAKFKTWAHDNYDKGGDVFVECYSDPELVTFIEEHGGTYAKAVKAAKGVSEVREEQRTNAILDGGGDAAYFEALLTDDSVQVEDFEEPETGELVQAEEAETVGKTEVIDPLKPSAEPAEDTMTEGEQEFARIMAEGMSETEAAAELEAARNGAAAHETLDDGGSEIQQDEDGLEPEHIGGTDEDGCETEDIGDIPDTGEGRPDLMSRVSMPTTMVAPPVETTKKVKAKTTLKKAVAAAVATGGATNKTKPGTTPAPKPHRALSVRRSKEVAETLKAEAKPKATPKPKVKVAAADVKPVMTATEIVAYIDSLKPFAKVKGTRILPLDVKHLVYRGADRVTRVHSRRMCGNIKCACAAENIIVLVGHDVMNKAKKRQTGEPTILEICLKCNTERCFPYGGVKPDGWTEG